MVKYLDAPTLVRMSRPNVSSYGRCMPEDVAVKVRPVIDVAVSGMAAGAGLVPVAPGEEEDAGNYQGKKGQESC